MKKLPWILIVLLPIPLAGCPRPVTIGVSQPAPLPVVDQTYKDRLQSYADIMNALNKSDTFDVIIPAGFVYGPGTVIIPNGGAFDICSIPTTDFPAGGIPITFIPPIGTSSDFSVTGGLPAAFLGGTVGASLSVTAGESVSLGFSNLNANEAYLSEFLKLISTAGCATSINQALNLGKTVTIVRGVISGQETYNFSNAPSLAATLSVAHIANLSVAAKDGTTPIAYTETSASPHFLITYSIIAPITAAPAPSVAVVSSTLPPTPATSAAVATAASAASALPAPIPPSANAVQALADTIVVTKPVSVIPAGVAITPQPLP